jgi:hypothetical protein
MKPTLHIIASCTDRKRVAVPIELRLRSVPLKAIPDRAKAWWLRLSRHPGQVFPAADLYAGGHWAVVRTLPEVGRRAGYNVRLWVISAGYGLVKSSALLHPYSATFAGTHPDTVATSTANGQPRKNALQKWWDALSAFPGPDTTEPRALSGLVQRSRNAHFLIVASRDYLAAIESDLLTATELIADPNKLIIITSRSEVGNEHLSHNLVPTNARLQARLGGARGSLSARIALMILQNADAWGLSADVVVRRLRNLIVRSPELPKLERERVDDDQVRDFIRKGLKQHPQSSCSSLLRSLRDSELACEQSRFKKIYWEVREGMQ